MPNHYFFAQVCQGIRCALVGGIIVPSMVSPAKPCSPPALLKPVLLKTTSCLAMPILLNPHPSPAQTSPRSKPYTLLNHANHLLKPCPPALPKPCPKPALLKQALLKPRPAQTTTCSTMSCSTNAHILLKPHPAQALPKRRPRSKPYLAQPRPSPALSNKPPLCQILP